MSVLSKSTDIGDMPFVLMTRDMRYVSRYQGPMRRYVRAPCNARKYGTVQAALRELREGEEVCIMSPRDHGYWITGGWFPPQWHDWDGWR